jgi:DNA mismatch repair ATPase MutS
MNREMKIIREVHIQAENFYKDAVKLGDHAAYVLKAQHRSQMTNLENIAESAFKATDILDYIKKQTARFSFWRQQFPEDKDGNISFGERLKRYLENNLQTTLENICSPNRLNIGETIDEDKQERRRIYLLLIRQFIRQMTVEYEYQVNFGSTGSGNKKREA